MGIDSHGTRRRRPSVLSLAILIAMTSIMEDGKEDLARLPCYGDNYRDFMYKLAYAYGWLKGPITDFMLWNKPWEGLSSSGWRTDDGTGDELRRIQTQQSGLPFRPGRALGE